MIVVCLNSLLFLSYVVISTATVSDRHGTCYQQYIPPRSGFPSARCRHPMGGHPSVKGIFIRNEFTCCRRRTAHGWGTASHCKSCSSVRGFLRSWGQWSVCSATCGWGRQRRYRYCSNGVCAGIRGRRQMETRACMWKTCCPVDGNWSDWAGWSDCSASCGDGLQYRTRSCSSPPPSCGGRPCRSYPRQMQRCRVGSCAHWASWTTQTPCSVTCGDGVIRRTRECHSQLGDTCIGDSESYSTCTRGTCEVSGEWCSWGSWSSCTASCADTLGTQKRGRSCRCPAPKNGGKDCVGSDGEVKYCHPENNCPVSGGWSAWSPWSECNAARCSFLSGTQRRKRLCNNPYPLHGGSCNGVAEQARSCLVLGGCEIEGVYGKWSEWTSCSASCGLCGRRTRFRSCFTFINHKKISFQKIIGVPKIICEKRKSFIIQTCNQGLCPDGSLPCGPTTVSVTTSSVPSTEATHLIIPATTSVTTTRRTVPGSKTTHGTRVDSVTSTISPTSTPKAKMTTASTAATASPHAKSQTIVPDVAAVLDDTMTNSEDQILKEYSHVRSHIGGLEEEIADNEDARESAADAAEDDLSLLSEYDNLEPSQGNLDDASDANSDEDGSGESYDYDNPPSSYDDDLAGGTSSVLDIPGSEDEFAGSLEDSLAGLENAESPDEFNRDLAILRRLEEADAAESAAFNGGKADTEGEDETLEYGEEPGDENYDYADYDPPFPDGDSASPASDDLPSNDEQAWDDMDDSTLLRALEDSLEDPSISSVFSMPTILDGDAETSGEPGEEKPVRGCDALNRVRGPDASVASGCCEVLTYGAQNLSSANTTRLEECLFLHYKYAMDFSGDMTDEEQLLARASGGGRCLYKQDASLLQTICCVRKYCKQWRHVKLRNQCISCKNLNYCPSCSNILLSG